jgi:hypothetical protein
VTSQPNSIVTSEETRIVKVFQSSRKQIHFGARKDRVFVNFAATEAQGSLDIAQYPFKDARERRLALLREN